MAAPHRAAASPLDDRAGPSAPEKTPLLLLPGLLCDETVWRPQVATLAAVAEAIVPDWGARDSLTAMAEHALSLAPPGPFALAGHSMGGRVALEVMRLAPARVARLALLDTGYAPLAAGEEGERERAGRLALLALAREEGMRAMGRRWATPMVHPSRLDTPLFEEILAMIERKTPEIFAAQIRALLGRADAAAVLAAVRCPTLVLVGRDDVWSGVAQHERLAAMVPVAELVVVEESGHMVTMEQPQAVSTALRRWLAR